MKKNLCHTCFLVTTVLLAGCANLTELLEAVTTPPPVESPVENPKKNAENEAARKAAQSALNEGIQLYGSGDYNGTVKHLAVAKEIWTADKDIQVEALKYMAFSYCVTFRQALCKQQFEKAVKLDPTFDLAPGEKGHPLWGPVFYRVKKGN